MVSSFSYAQDSSNNFILALSVDLYMNTSSRVSCDRFVTAFNKTVSMNVITQSDSLVQFFTFVKKAKYARHDRGIDVRCKFLYELDEAHTTTVCTDGKEIILNGRLLKQNKKFIDFLNSMVHRYPYKS